MRSTKVKKPAPKAWSYSTWMVDNSTYNNILVKIEANPNDESLKLALEWLTTFDNAALKAAHYNNRHSFMAKLNDGYSVEDVADLPAYEPDEDDKPMCVGTFLKLQDRGVQFTTEATEFYQCLHNLKAVK